MNVAVFYVCCFMLCLVIVSCALLLCVAIARRDLLLRFVLCVVNIPQSLHLTPIHSPVVGLQQ